MALVQTATGVWVPNSGQGDVVLAAPPTLGNLLVCAHWSRGALAPALVGFTAIPGASVDDGGGGNVRGMLSIRRVIGGDGTTWPSEAAIPSTFYSLTEWSGLADPTGGVGGIYDFPYPTDPDGLLVSPAGDGLVMAAFLVGTAISDRVVHVSGPTTLIAEAAAEEAGNDTWGSWGYRDVKPATGTAMNNQFQSAGFVGANFDGAAAGGSRFDDGLGGTW